MTIPELTIYIPTFNRLSKLKNCLNAIKSDIVGHESKVTVYVSNNASTDGTKEYLDSLDWIKVRHNETNLGYAGNVIHGYNLPFKSKFVWIIGDDDYLISGSISELLNLTKLDVDYIFCNTTAFNPNQEQSIWENFPKIPVGSVKGKYSGTFECKFPDLIDPKVADTLLGELMVNCFRQDAVRWDSPIENDKTDGRIRQAHNIPLISAFTKETKAVYSHTPRTFNFWGTAEWLNDYDYVFPVIMLWLINEYKKFVIEDKYFALLDYYFQLMGGSIERQINNSTTAIPFNDNFKEVLNSTFKEFINYQTRANKPEN
jgi:glycosyltransferase involved in cell wall biosynthesis